MAGSPDWTRRGAIVSAASFWLTAAASPGPDQALLATFDAALAALKAAAPADLGSTRLAIRERLAGVEVSGASPIRRAEHRAILQGLDAEIALAGEPQDNGPQTTALALSLALGRPCNPVQARAAALAEIGRLGRRADTLLRGLGRRKCTVAERLAALMAEPEHRYPQTDAGRDEAVADMNRRIAALVPKLGEAFGSLSVAQAEVRAMPAEAVGKAGYRTAPADGAPGVYYPDFSHIEARPSWTLPSVAFHEVIPGHLLQLPLQALANPHPLRLRYSSAYFEAWAIYAEALAIRLGAYRTDALGELGEIHWRLFRMGRIVADIGLHASGWSRDRAIAVLGDIQGPAVAFVSVEADVDRMIASPAAYAAQGLGALALDDMARRYGRGAKAPAFHAAVLRSGPWPFGVLENIASGRTPL